MSRSKQEHWALTWKSLFLSAESNWHWRKQVHVKSCSAIGKLLTAFLKCNLPVLPIGKFSLCGGGENAKKVLHGGVTGTGIPMDPRCFSDHFSTLASVTQNIHMNLQHQQHMINDMRNHLRCEKALTKDFVLGQPHTMMRSIQRLENHLIGKPTARLPSLDAPRTIPFSISSKGLTNQMSVVNVFVTFFAKDCRIGHELDKNNWKEDGDAPPH